MVEEAILNQHVFQNFTILHSWAWLINISPCTAAHAGVHLPCLNLAILFGPALCLTHVSSKAPQVTATPLSACVIVNTCKALKATLVCSNKTWEQYWACSKTANSTPQSLMLQSTSEHFPRPWRREGCWPSPPSSWLRRQRASYLLIILINHERLLCCECHSLTKKTLSTLDWVVWSPPLSSCLIKT